MSEQEPDMELQALQRQLDDAFETTRPRSGFEDELWTRMQATRPTANRVGDAIAAFFRGVRAIPAVPTAAVAAALIVVVGVGLFAYAGLGHGGTGGASGGTQLSNENGLRAASQAANSFGRIPSPALNASPPAPVPGTNLPAGAEYSGLAQLVWAGTVTALVAAAPVFRYSEPSTTDADQFASELGAALRARPAGFLGSYSGSTYTLKVRGTVQSPPSSPAYFIFASLTMPAVEAAGASSGDLATIFLTEHNLMPQWPYDVSIDSTGDPVKVRFERQFEVPGYGLADLVDQGGNRYGIEVDLSANRPVLASGLLPTGMDAANYSIVSPADAIRPALNLPAIATAFPPPKVELTKADLVYVLVPAGDHSFYEPAWLFSGTLVVNGISYVKHVLEPAVVPTQRAA